MIELNYLEIYQRHQFIQNPIIRSKEKNTFIFTFYILWLLMYLFNSILSTYYTYKKNLYSRMY